MPSAAFVGIYEEAAAKGRARVHYRHQCEDAGIAIGGRSAGDQVFVDYDRVLTSRRREEYPFLAGCVLQQSLRVDEGIASGSGCIPFFSRLIGPLSRTGHLTRRYRCLGKKPPSSFDLSYSTLPNSCAQRKSALWGKWGYQSGWGWLRQTFLSPTTGLLRPLRALGLIENRRRCRFFAVALKRLGSHFRPLPRRLARGGAGV